MHEGVYGCFMPCNIFLAGNSEVTLELQCFTAELITYIVCECDAPEWFYTEPLQALCSDRGRVHHLRGEAGHHHPQARKHVQGRRQDREGDEGVGVQDHEQRGGDRGAG